MLFIRKCELHFAFIRLNVDQHNFIHGYADVVSTEEKMGKKTYKTKYIFLELSFLIEIKISKI